MRLAGITPGDIVAVNVRGHEFLALVEEPMSTGSDKANARVLRITPLKGSGGTQRWATSRQVVGHFKRRGERRPRHVLVGL